MRYRVKGVIAAPISMSPWAAVKCSMVYMVSCATVVFETMSPSAEIVIRGMIYIVYGITAALATMFPLAVVIFLMIYTRQGNTAAPQTMSPWAAVICSTVYKVKAVAAAPEAMCAGATVICMMVYKV